MSQNDYVIANDTAANVRADINLALAALASQSSGATAPSTTYANMIWYDTATDTLKMRSESNTAWITLGTLDQNTNTFTPAGLANLSQSVKDILNATGSAPVYACRAWVNFNGTGTVAIRGAGNVSSITDNGTGDYTVNFTTALPDVNYSVVCAASTSGVTAATSPSVGTVYGGQGGLATGSVRVVRQVGSAVDGDLLCVSVFR